MSDNAALFQMFCGFKPYVTMKFMTTSDLFYIDSFLCAVNYHPDALCQTPLSFISCMSEVHLQRAS